MTDMELAEETERLLEKMQEGLRGGDGEWYFTVEEAKIIIAALRRGPEPSEKAAAWLIIHHSDTGKAKQQEREVVLSPLTDDTYMDEGDEAWPLYLHPKRPPSGEMVAEFMPCEAQPNPEPKMVVPIATLDRIMRDCEHGSRIWKECDALLRAYRLAAAEAEGRKSCPLCGRTDPHSHTSGPLGMS